MRTNLVPTRWSERLMTVASALALTMLSSGAAAAISPDETDPRKIAKAVEDRDDGDKRTARVSMVLKDASGRERSRTLRQRSMDFAEGSKSIMLFEAPADVRNTGLLSIDYDAGDKDDDQWLYLPSLHKSTRISTSDKSGSFLGTDISYSDMTSKDVDAYDYKLLEQSTKVGGEECWLIEARPRTQKEKDETGYLKTHTWISKSKLMPLQVKAWVKEGKKLKYMKFEDIEQIDGIWVAKTMKVMTKKGGKMESVTVMKFADLRFNDPSVDNDDFTQRALEKGL